MSDTVKETSIAVPGSTYTPAESEIESSLDREIESLWSAHHGTNATAKHSRQELKTIRRDLGQKLHARKSIVVRTGRNGGWAAYLRSLSIPRASADRYVTQHELSLIPKGKRITEAISVPTEYIIQRLVRRLLPQVRRILTTPQSVSWFAAEVTAQLAALDSRPPGHIETEPASL